MYDIDGIGVMRLLEIIRTLDADVRNRVKFYQTGTSELYGKVLETPQCETTPFNPVSPYAAAKLYAYHMVKIYREGYGLFAVNGILFNHESPRRGENFVTAKIINGIKDIINGKKDVIQLGNLDSKRDWGHAKDYVYGMWLMLQQDKPDDFVLATGKTWTIREFIEKAFLYKNMQITWSGSGLNEKGITSDGKIRIIINPKYYNLVMDLLLGDPTSQCIGMGA